MTLESLLKKHSKIAKEMEKARALERNFNKSLDTSKVSIEKEIDREFKRHIKTINEKLPKKRRITEWRVHYDGGIKRAFISIKCLGRKPYYAPINARNPEELPDYLKDVKRFGQNYPIEFHFNMIDHSNVGDSLDELK